MRILTLHTPAILTAAATFGYTLLPQSTYAQCCGGTDGVSSSAGGSPHGSLSRIFGGSDNPRRVRLRNTGTAPVSVTSHGRTFTIAEDSGSERVFTTGGVDAATGQTPLFAGESYSNSVTNTGNSNGGEIKEKKMDDDCPYIFTGSDGEGWQEAPEETETPIPENGMTQTGPRQMVPAPDKGESGDGEGHSSKPGKEDRQDFGHGGASLAPGSLSLGAMSVTPSWPGPLAAVSMGPAANGSRGRIGFVVPDKGANSTYDYKNADDYVVRGALSSEYSPASTGTPGAAGYQRRWYVPGQGLIVLEQAVALDQTNPAVTYNFYALGLFSTTSPFGTERRRCPVSHDEARANQH